MKSARHQGLTLSVLIALSLLSMIVFSAGSASAAPRPTQLAAPAAKAAADHAGLRCKDHRSQTYNSSKQIKVPASYCYDDKTTTNPGWHDYCTHSPDSWGKANFRGPCAYHDMCLAAGKGHKVCDAALLINLRYNCDIAYGKLNPLRYTCRGTASSYFAVIKAYTWATSHH